MSNGEGKAERRWWQIQFRVWHLFAIITVASVAVWLSQHVGLVVLYVGDVSAAAIFWDDDVMFTVGQFPFSGR